MKQHSAKLASKLRHSRLQQHRQSSKIQLSCGPGHLNNQLKEQGLMIASLYTRPSND